MISAALIFLTHSGLAMSPTERRNAVLSQAKLIGAVDAGPVQFASATATQLAQVGLDGDVLQQPKKKLTHNIAVVAAATFERDAGDVVTKGILAQDNVPAIVQLAIAAKFPLLASPFVSIKFFDNTETYDLLTGHTVAWPSKWCQPMSNKLKAPGPFPDLGGFVSSKFSSVADPSKLSVSHLGKTANGDLDLLTLHIGESLLEKLGPRPPTDFAKVLSSELNPSVDVLTITTADGAPVGKVRLAGPAHKDQVIRFKHHFVDPVAQ